MRASAPLLQSYFRASVRHGGGQRPAQLCRPGAFPLQPTALQQRCTTTTRQPVVDFDNAKQAYRSKTTAQLLLAVVVFRLCTVGPLVRNAHRILFLLEKTLGKRLTFQVLVGRTFFRHFCAGESSDDLGPSLTALKSDGVGAILDYAAENDVPQEQRVNASSGPTVESMDDLLVSRQRADVCSARIFDYQGEQECDKNLDTILECIDHAAANAGDTDAFCAVKLTALCKPVVLERMSAILLKIRRSWMECFAPSYIARTTPLEEFRTVVSELPGARKKIDLQTWCNGLQRLCKVPVSQDAAERMFNVLGQHTNGEEVDYYDYMRHVTLEALAFRLDGGQVPHDFVPLTHSGAFPLLTEEESRLLANLVTRVKAFAARAVERRVNVMIDAEQTYLQTAIDHFVLLLQRQYNLTEPRVYNTYQCYLNFSKNRVQNDLERSRREGWLFAGKIVRGAYMVQEREIAVRKGYASPILSDLQATHDNFDECALLLLEELGQGRQLGVLFGSHNRKSLELIVETMQKLGIDKRHGGVYFGQLLGMADNLTLPLGQSGYNVYKYVPYGPVHEVVPYLIRRLQENSASAALADSETKLLSQELRRRVFG
eukprot:TRINITY_DN7625_c0_g1_i1.p1 TRINITY_DN7625_c0_g1~~TRINITY_DN7625_c0_g1_i1.p1  ORF type:complete len:600 (+),score=126.18 TRINITY_DN7625_c0_g1_i1:64-1863(+)